MPIAMREGKVVSDDIGTRTVGSQHLAPDAVGSSFLIADNVILTGHLANDAVGSSDKIADNVIGHDQMMDAAVGYSELTPGLQGSLGGAVGSDSIGTTELKEPAVGSQNIYGDAVYGAKIADDSIGSEHIIDDSIKSAAIDDGQVGYGHLTTGLKGTYMPKSGGTFIGSVDYSGAGKPPRLAILTPGGAITPVVLPAVGTAFHSQFSWYELRYPPDAEGNAFWEFQTPEYYDGGTIDVNIFWKGKVATNAGSVYWNILTLGRTTNEIWNTAMTNFGSLLATTLGSAKVNKTTISGKPDFTSDELAVVKIMRAGQLAQDNLAGTVSLLMVGIDFKAKK